MITQPVAILTPLSITLMETSAAVFVITACTILMASTVRSAKLTSIRTHPAI